MQLKTQKIKLPKSWLMGTDAENVKSRLLRQPATVTSISLLKTSTNPPP